MEMSKAIKIATVAAVLLGFATASEASPVRFVANLGNFENPPTGSAGTGLAVVDFDFTTHTMRVQVNFSGLTGLTTNSHIHCCTAPPGNIGVATTTPTFPGFPAGVQSGSYLNIFDMTLASSFNPAFVTASPGGTVAAAETRLFTGLQAGQAYFNLHTNLFPGGEIRGFLVQAPEPATLSLFGFGLLGLAARRRKKSA
jgi:CHRD domain/PEP-CTERM motif